MRASPSTRRAFASMTVAAMRRYPASPRKCITAHAAATAPPGRVPVKVFTL